MEVRPGYRLTELGLIPEEWEISALGKCLISRPSYGINAPAVPYSDRLPVYIRITDISEQGRFSPDAQVSVKSELSGNYNLSEGDIVLARTGASVGKSYQYKPSDGPLVYAGFLIRVRPDTQRLLPDFLAAYVTTGSYWRWVRLMSMRSGQPGINGNEYSQIPVPRPPIPEQRAIAAALSDVDALLDGLDRLISKKRDLKQAGMQQLLTGQTRLPGFSREWEVRSLDSLGTWRGGMTPSMQNPAFWDGGDFPWISSGDVKVSRLKDTSQHVTSWAVRQGAAVVVPGNSIVLVTRSGILRKYLPVALLERPMAINQDIKVLIPNETVRGDFLLHALTGRGDQILARCLKSGTTVESVEFPWLKAFAIPIPHIDEQTAIAAVLSDMDAELAALEARRDKTRDLKQGMMQELLTGRTRLVPPGAAHG
jgi:type I restriction enzyme S subunit